MRHAEIVTAVALLGVGGVVLYQAIRLDPGWGDIGPKAGFFPFWLGGTLALTSLWILIGAVRGRSARLTKPFLAPGALRKVLTVFLPMAGAFVLIEVVGFYVAALLYFLGYAHLTGRQSWRLTLGISVLFPLLTFLVFERWFLLPLPKGFFGERLLPF